MTHELPAISHDRGAEMREAAKTPPIEKLAYRIKEAAHALAISRSRLYELISAGEIRVLKDGARTLIRRGELEAYLLRLEQGSQSPALARSRSTNRP